MTVENNDLIAQIAQISTFVAEVTHSSCQSIET